MKVLIASLLLCAACGGPMPSSYELRVDTRMTDQTTVLDAAAEWHRATGVVFRPVISGDGCSVNDCIYVEEGQAPCAAAEGCEGTQSDGSNVSHIWMHRGLPAARAFKSALHELGHALIDGEHTGPGTAMCASSDCMSATVTRTDVERYLEKR
jgi:hypothetical protein